jgi:hypothetical protein
MVTESVKGASGRSVAVVLHGIHVPPFGTTWVDTFAADELVPITDL